MTDKLQSLSLVRTYGAVVVGLRTLFKNTIRCIHVLPEGDDTKHLEK